MEHERIRELLDTIPNKYYWFNVNTKPTKIRILVRATDCKSTFGKIRVLIEPLIGKGSCWVLYSNLSLEELPYGFINAAFVYKNDRITLQESK